MKKFVLAVFVLTRFQIIFILSLAALKYLLNTYKIIDKIEKPFVWFCIGAGVLFAVATGIMGIIENRGQSFEEWQIKPKNSVKEKILSYFVSWGFAIPGVLAYVVFLYIFIPNSISMLIAVYAGIVLRNCISFFLAKKTPLPGEQ